MSTTNTTTPIPVILTGHALQSLRDSGYSLPAALGEVIDNSLEAMANNVELWLDEGVERGKRHIHRIVVSDDGEGMDVEVIQRYLQVGYSTRYMSTKTIGKYGVGAKLAALNYATRIDVWSRTSVDDPWLHVAFDLGETIEAEEQGREPMIMPPDELTPPDDLVDRLPEGAGTMVVWSKVDRLEEGRLAEDAERLRVEVEKELSRMFRYFLQGGRQIWVNGRELFPHDPLYLMEGSWVDRELEHFYASKRGEELAAELGISWPQGKIPSHFAPSETFAAREEIKVGGSVATLMVTLAPREVLRKRGLGGDELARKLRVPDNLGAISFMRLGREISYTNVPRIFPSGVLDQDRYIGIEIAFSPELDDYFGVRNVKRGAEPHDQLRTEIRKRLERYIPQARQKIDEIWGVAATASQAHSGEHTNVVERAAEVDKTLADPRAVAPPPEEVEQKLDDFVRDVVGAGEDKAQAREEYKERIRDLPFVVESVDFPGSNFIEIIHLGHQMIIRLNTRHRFYREMWEPLKEVADAPAGTITPNDAAKAARRAVEALTLLLIAYGKAEGMNPNPHEAYDDLRMHWGQFLSTLLQRVKAA